MLWSKVNAYRLQCQLQLTAIKSGGLPTEAQWAHTLKKTVIPLRLEAGYEPDGWLGPLCRSILYYDFSTETKFETEWSRLETYLNEIPTIANTRDNGLYTIYTTLLKTPLSKTNTIGSTGI